MKLYGEKEVIFDQVEEALLRGASVEYFYEVRMSVEHRTKIEPTDVGYRVTSTFCGLTMSANPVTPKRAIQLAEEFEKAMSKTISNLGST